MKASMLKEVVKALFPVQRTLCIEGPPGGGKTSIVRQAAKELGVPLIERHMPTMLVEDFGVLYPKEGSTQLSYRLPEWYPAAGEAPDAGILLFDDRNQADADLQKVLANICQSRTLHGVPLPPGWMVVSTGNRQKDRAGANRVLGHLRNRETVVTLDSDLHESLDWMGVNGGYPPVLAYLEYRPGALHDYDPNRDANPSPRAWHEGVSLLATVVPPAAEYECFCGAVGEAHAAEYAGFLRIWRNLPPLKSIIEHPETAAVPDDAATLHALTGALAAAADAATFGAIIKYLCRMPGDYSFVTMLKVLRRAPELNSSAAFVEWASKSKLLKA